MAWVRGTGKQSPDLFPKTYVASTMPVRGVPGWGFKSDQSLGSLCATPFAGHNHDPGVG